MEVSGALRTCAVTLYKIANDIRWLSSGPRCGIGEIVLPALQPGSSIMPGKVNPVMAECVCQVAAQVMGNDTVIAFAGAAGNFELNVMMPLQAHNLLQSIELLANASTAFEEKCVRGITADRERCGDMIEKSLAMVTALSPVLGYDVAAAAAKEAFSEGKTIREIIRAKKLLSPKKIQQLLNPRHMV